MPVFWRISATGDTFITFLQNEHCLRLPELRCLLRLPFLSRLHREFRLELVRFEGFGAG